jgi:Family of unknown function (DUF6632)
MTNHEKHLRQSATLMRILGWALAVGLVSLLFIYPPGFLWGEHPEAFPNIGPAHPPSPYEALHPYLYMLAAMYVTYGILLIRGAKDPRRNVALFDYGILSSLAHGGVMVLQSFYYPNEHAHLWADVPVLFTMAILLWIWHPDRKQDLSPA